MEHCYHVYILLCSDNSYYIGVTNNLDRRVAEHNESTEENSYTYSRRPVKLVWHEVYNYIDQAIAREKQLKTWSRAKKEALMDQDIERLEKLAKKDFGKRKV